MIKYSEQEGIIKVHGIKFREGQNPNIISPKIAFGVFSRHLFQYIINQYECIKVSFVSCLILIEIYTF